MSSAVAMKRASSLATRAKSTQRKSGRAPLTESEQLMHWCLKTHRTRLMCKLNEESSLAAENKRAAAALYRQVRERDAHFRLMSERREETRAAVNELHKDFERRIGKEKKRFERLRQERQRKVLSAYARNQQVAPVLERARTEVRFWRAYRDVEAPRRTE